MSSASVNEKSMVIFALVTVILCVLGYFLFTWIYQTLPVSSYGEDSLGAIVWTDKSIHGLTVIVWVFISIHLGTRTGSILTSEDENSFPYPLVLRNTLFLICCALLPISLLWHMKTQEVFREYGVTVFSDFKTQIIPYGSIDKVGVSCEFNNRESPFPKLHIFSEQKEISEISVKAGQLKKMSVVDDIYRATKTPFVKMQDETLKNGESCTSVVLQSCSSKALYNKVLHLDELAGITE